MSDLSDLIQHYYYDEELGRRLVEVAEANDLWVKVGEGDPDENNYRCQQLKVEGCEDLREFEEQFLLVFQDVLHRYNKVVKTIATGDTGFTLLKYRTGDSCSEHIDQVPHEVRVCTAIFYINDDYEGGELVFPEQGLVLRPKPGQVVVTPATEEFPHYVEPVTKGIRYAVRCFYVCHIPDDVLAQVR
jgi:hypothetical protein